MMCLPGSTGKSIPTPAARQVQTGSTDEPSDSAPVPNQLFVDLHRLPDAFHAAVFVGLVRLLRLARSQHHRRRALVYLEKIPRVRVVGRGPGCGMLAGVFTAGI